MNVSLTQVLLPLILAFIMFSIGLTLKFSDFGNIAKNPKSFGLGFVHQLFMLPLVTFILVTIFQINNEMAFGMMLLSFCPGGATSNMLTQYIRGNVALSISLTAVMSVLSIFTVPVGIYLAYNYFIGSTSESINITAMGIKMFMIAVVPVLLGMLSLKLFSAFTQKITKPVTITAALLFVLLMVGAFIKNKHVLIDQYSTLGPLIITLIVTLLILGLSISRKIGLSWVDAKTIALETGIQNGTMAIVLSGIMLSTNEAIPIYAIPAALYGLLMYAVCLPFIAVMRFKN